MKIPIVLSTVRADVTADGRLLVAVDGEPYANDRHLGRAELRLVLDEITTNLGTAVRVEVREAGGASYADIATPPDPPAPASEEPQPPLTTPALAGAGFRPGEEVALAYVVARQAADSDGNTSIHLPPALLASTRGGLVLLGLSSQTVAPIEATA
ncbi:hypothetical protein [Nocardioides allogilvus]|uniref:hypothetical protein n=1 Tax=Nocardioides allogilvus TaxID=2072017 RepID=UPI000D32030C|nr:hypothetical protein [Nocardioides allogilvus]